MTWSPARRRRRARCRHCESLFAVGVLCPHARSGVGALSTQASSIPLRRVSLLAQGTPPSEMSVC
jgi:uncharacterized Ntn-hydrolase superfamily protein